MIVAIAATTNQTASDSYGSNDKTGRSLLFTYCPFSNLARCRTGSAKPGIQNRFHQPDVEPEDGRVGPPSKHTNRRGGIDSVGGRQFAQWVKRLILTKAML